jgi:hypothetical protein
MAPKIESLSARYARFIQPERCSSTR